MHHVAVKNLSPSTTAKKGDCTGHGDAFDGFAEPTPPVSLISHVPLRSGVPSRRFTTVPASF
jgi:hypothetical protein